MQLRFPSILAVPGLILLGIALPADAAVKTATWSAKALTVVKTPFGVTVPLNTVVSGFFTFDTAAPDKAPANSLLGDYPQTANAALEADFLGNKVTGSTTPFYEVDLGANPSNDTFRIWDGPRPVGNQGGTMSFNGVANTKIQLFVAVTAGVFSNDALIDPFPLYNFGPLGDPHTFTIGDDQGTLLLQFTSAAEAVCGDANGGGITAGDALIVLKAAVGARSCLKCICDVDANGIISSSDALKVLRYAVSASPALHCSVCL